MIYVVVAPQSVTGDAIVLFLLKILMNVCALVTFYSAVTFLFIVGKK
jgi:hypothetical protein